MLKPHHDAPVELPQVGSFGYLRGTAQPALVIRRNRAQVAAGGSAEGGDTSPQTCMVKLFERVGLRLVEVRDASGNREVEERDLYPTADQAAHAGRTPRRRAPRKARRS